MTKIKESLNNSVYGHEKAKKQIEKASNTLFNPRSRSYNDDEKYEKGQHKKGEDF